MPPQVAVAFEGASLLARGQRPGEQAGAGAGLEWGTDPFGSHVRGDLDGFCDGLRKEGVTFTLDPVDFTPAVGLAFIEAPDGVSVEILQRKGEVCWCAPGASGA